MNIQIFHELIINKNYVNPVSCSVNSYKKELQWAFRRSNIRDPCSRGCKTSWLYLALGPIVSDNLTYYY